MELLQEEQGFCRRGSTEVITAIPKTATPLAFLPFKMYLRNHVVAEL